MNTQNLQSTSTPHSTDTPPPIPENYRVFPKPSNAPAPQPEEAPARKSGPRWQHLPILLRYLGGATLVISAISFLISGWADEPAILRYYGFLGFTAIMTLAGIFCVVRWKEDKGARTFLGFSTAFLPVHAVQLGGLLYLALNMGGGATLPKWLSAFQFAPVQGPVLWTTFALSGVLLPLVAFVGFSSLARKDALRLSTLYLGANALLLLPWREPVAVFYVALAGTLAVAALDQLWFSSPSRLKNLEGRVARGLLFSPFILLIGRNLLLFEIDSLLLAYAGAALTAVSFHVLPQFKINGKRLLGFQEAALPLAAITWLLFLDGAFGIPFWQVDLNTFVLPLAVLMAVASIRVEKRGHVWRYLAAASAIASVTWQMFFDPSAHASIACIVVSILVTVAAFLMEEKGLLRWGIIGLVLGAIYHFRYLVLFGAENRWIALAVLGTAIILLGSFLEKNSSRIRGTLKNFRLRVHDWK